MTIYDGYTAETELSWLLGKRMLTILDLFVTSGGCKVTSNILQILLDQSLPPFDDQRTFDVELSGVVKVLHELINGL